MIEASQRSADWAVKRQGLRSLDALRQGVTGPALSAALDAPWAPVYVLICFLIHPLIGVAVVIGGLLLLLVAVRNERVLRERLAESASLAPQLYALTEMEAQSAGAFRALGMRGAIIDRQIERRRKLNENQARATFDSSTYASLTKFVRLTLQSTVLGLGAWLAIQREISPGALIAASILASRALAPIEQIVGSWRQLVESRHALNALRDSLAEAPAEAPKTQLPTPKGRLVFDQIVAAVGDRAILRGVSFAIAPGEIVCVVGPSGAGKSTLARVAAGALAPVQGSVRLDGANLADWNDDDLGRHVGFLPQEISLVQGSIADNIRRLQPRASARSEDAAVVEAATAAGAHDMILRLPKGYDAELAIGGVG
ncbi:MAG: ATP-binding cassette domain-containing protein, partial [Parvularculaceae bacterium]|nr:ATP-binding cassette domain-containing protein [Parvularculaceae bacterium]